MRWGRGRRASGQAWAPDTPSAPVSRRGSRRWKGFAAAGENAPGRLARVERPLRAAPTSWSGSRGGRPGWAGPAPRPGRCCRTPVRARKALDRRSLAPRFWVVPVSTWPSRVPEDEPSGARLLAGGTLERRVGRPEVEGDLDVVGVQEEGRRRLSPPEPAQQTPERSRRRTAPAAGSAPRGRSPGRGRSPSAARRGSARGTGGRTRRGPRSGPGS